MAGPKTEFEKSVRTRQVEMLFPTSHTVFLDEKS